MKSSSLLVILILVLSVKTNPLRAQDFASVEGKFSISFPCEYEQEPTSEGENTSKVSCVKDGQTFYIGYTIHDMEMNDSEDQSFAQISLDSFIEAVSGNLITQWDWQLGENKGIKSVIALSENQSILEYRVILKDFLQYQLLVFAPTNTYSSKLADEFFKSFKITQ